MVRPAFITAHGLRNPHIPLVPLPNDKVVKYMPVLGVRVHTRRLVVVGQTEDFVGDEKIMSGAGLQQKETVAVTLACNVFSHHCLPRHMISAHIGVKITRNDEHVCSGHGRDGRRS